MSLNTEQIMSHIQMMKKNKMESHEHKRQLEEIQARRIAYLRSKAKDNKLIQLHLSKLDKQQ